MEGEYQNKVLIASTFKLMIIALQVLMPIKFFIPTILVKTPLSLGKTPIWPSRKDSRSFFDNSTKKAII